MYRQSEKNLLNINTSSTCPDNMVNFGLLTAEICWQVWGTPANFNGFCVLAAILHGTLVVGVSQTLRCWTEGATYIWQGGHHIGHWPTFLVLFCFEWNSICILHTAINNLQMSPMCASEAVIFCQNKPSLFTSWMLWVIKSGLVWFIAYSCVHVSLTCMVYR